MYVKARNKEDIALMAERTGLKKAYFETISEKEYENELSKVNRFKRNLSQLFGYICTVDSEEWWVRRKEKGKSEIVISQEEFTIKNGRKTTTRIQHHDLDYALSIYCNSPEKVKETVRKIKNVLG